MKKKLDKNVRIGIVGISIILALISLLLLYGKGIKQYHSEETKVVYEYEKTADIHYQVNLKPNSLYNMESVSEEAYYITAFIDSIDATFMYELQGEEGTKIEGNYDITAVIESYEEIEGVQKSLWEKEFTIIPTKNFKGEERLEIVEEKVSVNLVEYINYVNKFMEESGVNFPVKLTVGMNVNLYAKTSKGNIEEISSPSIEIPLNETVFGITLNHVGTDTGTIEETQTITIGPSIPAIIIFSLSTIGLLLGIMYIFVFTIEKEQDPSEVYVRKVLKNYGNRLVALNQDIHFPDENSFIVHSIEDLVKIADEIAMPIFYSYKESYREIKEFYVFQDQSVYCLLVKEGIKENLYNHKPGKTKKKPLVAIEESR